MKPLDTRSCRRRGVGAIPHRSGYGLLWIVGSALLVGCKEAEVKPPEPIAVEQAADKLAAVSAQQQAAAKAADAADRSRAEVKTLFDTAAEAFRSGNHSKALSVLQTILARSDLTPQQRQAASSSMLAVNKALSEQAASGNAQAQQAVRNYRATK